MSKTTILIADDNADYRASLRELLELDEYTVHEAATLKEAKDKLESGAYGLVLADLRFTDHDEDKDFSGLMVAEWAADNGIPCIVVTAFATVEAARLALRSQGADPLAQDLIPKQDGPRAVLQQVQLVLARQEEETAGEPQADASFALRVDLRRKLVYLKGEPLGLSRLQYDLVAYMYAREGAVCSSQELVEAVYGERLTIEQANLDRRLERLVERVREKIEDNPHQPRRLIRVHGRGYRLVCQD
jgi:DNA-binding response OmpR family regulator